MSETITVGELTPNDIGRTVRVHWRETTVVGALNSLRLDTDWIDVRSMEQAPEDAERVPGVRTVEIGVGPWVTSQLPTYALVEVDR